MYVYIDESGDTGYTKKSTRYFILTAVIVESPFLLRRIAKSVHKTKIDRDKLNILHAYDENKKTKNILVTKLEDEEVRCIVFVLDKKKTEEKDPYQFLLKRVAKYFTKTQPFSIILARKETRYRYNKSIADIFIFNKLNFEFATPMMEKSLQIADFYSWVTFSYLEHGYSEYFLKLESQILCI